MQEEKIKALICKHLDQSLSTEETRELDTFIALYPELRALVIRLEDEEALGKDLRLFANTDLESNFQKTWSSIAQEKTPLPELQPKRSRRIFAPMAAAAILLIGITGSYWWRTQNSSPAANTLPASVTIARNDVPPGYSRATLTMGDGNRLRLDSISPGNLSAGNGTTIKLDSGTLEYLATGKKENNPAYHILTVPAGGQFALILPDRTKVWLNNSSSLRYPVRMDGQARNVVLDGEAYFEVRTDASRPFHVQVKGMDITVLGTRFCVSAYTNEHDIRTTLLDGKVQVNTGKKQYLLSPNEELISGSGQEQLEKEVEADEAIAWKEGYFHFTHADLHTVLRQICRWYDLDLDIQATGISHIYDGEMNRNLPLSDILKNLSNKDVHFQLVGRKLIVMR